MKDLIERLERATAGSRELDLMICSAAYGDRPVPLSFNLQPFSSSVDAALTLVPEGWQISLRFPFRDGRNADCELAHYGHMPFSEHSDWERWCPRVTAATPAIALCIAALKARTA